MNAELELVLYECITEGNGLQKSFDDNCISFSVFISAALLCLQQLPKKRYTAAFP